jgi:hypothetical protein
VIRTLSLVAALGFILALVCFGVAFGIAGGPFSIQDWSVRHWSWGDHVTVSHDTGSHDAGSEVEAQRPLAWTGGETLSVSIPAEVTYVQGPGNSLVLNGPEGLLKHVVVREGRITLDPGLYDGGRLRIQLTAPDVRRFELDGDQTLKIEAYDRDRLDLVINGSGSITGAGKAREVELNISGSGRADLTALAMDAARVDISGSGDATLGPKASARIDISGDGDVKLLTNPPVLQTDISGSGHVGTPKGVS